MSNYDLLFSHSLQNVAGGISNYVKLQHYSVDSVVATTYGTTLLLSLPQHLVAGRFSLPPEKVLIDDQLELESLYCRNKIEIPTYSPDEGIYYPVTDPLVYRTFYQRDRAAPFSILSSTTQPVIPSRDYIKIIIKECTIYDYNRDTSYYLQEVHYYIDLNVSEGRPVINVPDGVETTDRINYLLMKVNSYFNFKETDEDSNISTLVRNGYADLTVYGLPAGKYTVQLRLGAGNILYSETSYRAAESFLPTNTLTHLDSVEQKVTLEAIALSLLPLVNDTKFYIINGIIDRLSFFVAETDTLSLASEFNRFPPYESNHKVDLYSVCLFVYTLTESLAVNRFVRAKPLLGDLISIISKSFSYRDVFIKPDYYIEGYVEDNFTPDDTNTILGIVQQVEDFKPTITAHLAINNYLAYYYDAVVHYISAKLKLRLLHITSSVDLLSYSLGLHSTSKRLVDLSWFYIWAYVFDYADNRQIIQQLLLDSLTTDPLDTTKDSLIVSIALKIGVDQGYIPTGDVNLTYWNPVNFLTEIGEGVYDTSEGNEMLLASTMVRIYNENLIRPVKYIYDDYALEALSLQSLILQKVIRSMPRGNPWFSEKALIPGVGVIGSLLKASVEGLMPVMLKYFIRKKGFLLDRAQGEALDLWGRFFNRPRKINEHDQDYRQILQAFSKVKALTIEEFKYRVNQIEPDAEIQTVFINALDEDKHDKTIKQIKRSWNRVNNTLKNYLKSIGTVEFSDNFTIPNSVYDKENGEYVEWTSLEHLLELAEQHDPPAIYLDNKTSVPISDVFGVLYITLDDTTSAPLNEAVERLKYLGIDIRYKVYKTFYSSNQSYIIYAGSHSYS